MTVEKPKAKQLLYVCLLITLTISPKAELRRAQLNGINKAVDISVSTPTNHSRSKQRDELNTIPSNYM